jgi:hypothetical protein
MSALLRGARVFSSETENNASVKQEMTTNINVKLKDRTSNERERERQPRHRHSSSSRDSHPSYPTLSPYNDVNFTQDRGADITMPTTMGEVGAMLSSPSPVYNQHQPVVRSLTIDEENALRACNDELENEKQILSQKNNVLEALLEAYEGAPIVMHGLLILESKKLIEIIQTLTQADKVEILANDPVGCGCCGSNPYFTVSKIFCICDGKRSEFKVQFNEEYSLLIRHGVSLKIVRQSTG